MEKLSFRERVVLVQASLKVPKTQYNSFGKYNYRNCEDVMEALKPLLLENSLCQMVSDEIEVVGDRIYVKSTVTVFDTGSDSFVKTSAFAREALSKKGMDDSQITGTASSYARKYALNGMWMIDDTKDSDHNSNSDKNSTNIDDLSSDIKKINDTKTVEKLGIIWNSMPKEKQKKLKAAVSKKKAELENNVTATVPGKEAVNA